MCGEDNYSLWEQHQREQDREEAQYPECSYCGHPITDDQLVDVEGELYHLSCFTDEHLKPTDDYIERHM